MRTMVADHNHLSVLRDKRSSLDRGVQQSTIEPFGLDSFRLSIALKQSPASEFLRLRPVPPTTPDRVQHPPVSPHLRPFHTRTRFGGSGRPVPTVSKEADNSTHIKESKPYFSLRLVDVCISGCIYAGHGCNRSNHGSADSLSTGVALSRSGGHNLLQCFLDLLPLYLAGGGPRQIRLDQMHNGGPHHWLEFGNRVFNTVPYTLMVSPPIACGPPSGTANIPSRSPPLGSKFQQDCIPPPWEWYPMYFLHHLNRCFRPLR